MNNPLDKHAVEAALLLKDKFGGKVSVFSMAPEDTQDNLREILAMGADEGYLISDRAFAGADTLATSYTLACAIKKVGEFDIIFTGNESADGGTAQVSAQLGEWLQLPHLMHVCALDYDGFIAHVKTKIDYGFMEYEVKLPAVFGVTREINTPRLTGVKGILKAKGKPIYMLRLPDLTNADKNYIGLSGSPTQPGEIYLPQLARQGKAIDGSPEEIADRLIEEIRKAGIPVGR